MRTIFKAVFAFGLTACASFAQDTNFGVRVPCEMQATAGDSEPRLATLTWLQGTTPLVVAEPLRRGRAIPYDAGTSVRMVIGPSVTGTVYAVRTNAAAVTNGYAVQWPTVGTNSAGAAWFYTLFFDKDGNTYWTGSGDLYITKTTSTATNGLEWIEYTVPSVGWANVVGDPASSTSLVAYVAAHGGTGGSGTDSNAWHKGDAVTGAVDSVARDGLVNVGLVASNAYSSATGAAAVAAGALDLSSSIFDNPYADGGTPYKGQIHFHSTTSDGAQSPLDMVTSYKNIGYNFVCLTDHDSIAADPGVAGILFIPGVEETVYVLPTVTGNYSHVVSVGATATQMTANVQDTVDVTLNQGAIPFIAHPNWSVGWTPAQVASVYGPVAMEVFNGICERLTSTGYAATNWDAALTAGIRVWGDAVDDAHSNTNTEFNSGWVVVNASALTTNAILSAIRRGNFYATQGPDIRFTATGNVITVTTSNSASIVFYGRNGTVLSSNAAATSASYAPRGGELYVRAEVMRTSDGKRAWGQPFFIRPAAGDGRNVAASAKTLYANELTIYDTIRMSSRTTVTGDRFGVNAGSNSVASYMNAYGEGAGNNAAGSYINAFGRNAAQGSTGTLIQASAGAGQYMVGTNLAMYGRFSGSSSRGDTLAGFGYAVLMDAPGLTNSAAYGIYAGRKATGSGMMFADVYSTDPTNTVGHNATNDVIFSQNGNLSLGRGGDAPGTTNTLRGKWNVPKKQEIAVGLDVKDASVVGGSDAHAGALGAYESATDAMFLLYPTDDGWWSWDGTRSSALWYNANGDDRPLPEWQGRVTDTESSRIAQSYAGDTSLGTGTNITLTGTTYSYSASPSNAYTLSVATNAARFAYSITIFGTNTCTLPANFILRGSATAGGTNEVVLKPYGTTNWFVFWRGQ